MHLYKFSKNRFCGDRWVVCSFLRRIRPSGSGPKINFDKNFGSGPAGLDRGVVVTRETVIGSRQALHVITDFESLVPGSEAGWDGGREPLLTAQSADAKVLHRHGALSQRHESDFCDDFSSTPEKFHMCR